MTGPDRAVLEAHLHAAAGLVGVPVAPERREGVVRFLALNSVMSATMETAA